MRRQLLEMAGGDALIRVDSFEGAALPPKSQIKSIHITRDQFAAENHNAGGLFIDIITQPGLGAIRGGGNFRLRNGSLSGRSPFTPTKGPENIKNFGFNLGGSLIRNRSSLLARRQRDAVVRHAQPERRAPQAACVSEALAAAHAARTTSSSTGCGTWRSRPTRRCASATTTPRTRTRISASARTTFPSAPTPPRTVRTSCGSSTPARSSGASSRTRA